MNHKFLSALFVCVLILSLFVAGCDRKEDNSPLPAAPSSVSSTAPVAAISDGQNTGSSVLPKAEPDESATPSERSESDLQILVEADGNQITFQLNGSAAAQDFYDQLPLSTWIENYGNNEKIFYPPDTLNVADTPMAEKASAGTLAYYEPWGDVVFFYGNHEGAAGLYELGQTISGTEEIENLTGEILISRLEGNDDRSAAASESSAAPAGQQPSQNTPVQQEPMEVDTEMKLYVQVGDSVFTATLEDNTAVDAFVEMMKNGSVVIQMRDYSGFEKVGSLGTSLPTSDRQTTTQSGDIVLYTGNQIVVFYGSNSWSYTRLGRIDDLTGWEEALGSGDVSVSFSLSQ